MLFLVSVANNSTTDPVTGEFVTTSEAFSGTAPALVLIGIVTGPTFFVWDTCLKVGRTGYTVGKGILGIRLIGEATGQPIGAGMALSRSIAHILDSLPCYLGYFWPLWDAKRQTFADKVTSTTVIDSPSPDPAQLGRAVPSHGCPLSVKSVGTSAWSA